MYDRMHGFDGGYDYGHGGVWWHVLMMVLLIAVVGLVAWLILSRATRNHHAVPTAPGSGADRAITTLRERLARSEITEEEYRSRLALLQDQGAPSS